MKKYILLLLISTFAVAQNNPIRSVYGFLGGVNSNDMPASAIGDFRSTTQGFLVPRMTTTQRNAISGPATSLLIFNTTTGVYNYYNGSAWTDFGGSGTVTTVSVVTANGVTGSVANATTTPAITLSLGAITPTTVVASSTISATNFSGSSSGTNTGDQTSIVGIMGTMAQFDTAVTNGNIVYQGEALGTPSSGVATNLTGTASGLTAGNVTTNANLTGPITSVGNATSIASQTGTGTTFVVQNTPTLTTPNIGAATGTSVVLSAGATIAAASPYLFSGRGGIYSGSDGNYYVANNAGNSAGRIGLGGLTSNDPAIQRNSMALDFVNGNNTQFISYRALSGLLSGQSTTQFALKITPGSLLTTTQAGAIEATTSHIYYTPVASGPRYQLDQEVIAGSFSGVGTATTTFTVTIGQTMANTTYKVPAPGALNVLSAAVCYITNKTTTTFDVVYLAGLTGTVAFDWVVAP